MSTPIVFIHGANSSSKTFEYIREKFPRADNLFVDYETEDGIESNIDDINDLIFATYGDTPVDLVGHSLGGVKAVALHQMGTKVRRIVTISAPLGGSGAAGLLSWMFPSSKLYRDVSTHSAVISNIRSKPITVPVLSLVTTGGGMPIFREPNDGVVTVKSQTAIKGPDYRHVPMNHFEVLLSPVARDTIHDFLTKKELVTCLAA